MASIKGVTFGQRRPPLYHLITNILREYPSGQVFKEIIQNADDAGATEVVFYLDCRNLSTLPHELVASDEARKELYRFQGPALMAYNNAPFQEEDWDGIQNLQQSGKAENPHKVGKFGIGFNSVYHITDLAVIISEDCCGYLEPQEEIWRGESGMRYGLSALQSSCPVALQPYHAVKEFSPCQPFVGKTLFRLPLRNKASKLSPNVCTSNNIKQLLEALKAEAKYLLLFLRSVCSIEVIEMSDGSQHTEFKVAISPKNLENYQIQQKALLAKAKQLFSKDSKNFSKQVICEKTQFEIIVDANGHISTHHWLVVHRIGCKNDHVITLAKQKNVIPWVGTAYEFNESAEPDSGRIYCCLPLPTEDRVPFSINVNGTFAISSNRRSLNWESQERQGDDEGQWNRFLVERCIPHCYARLIQELIKVPSISPDVVYKCWPVISRVMHTPWEGLLQPLFQTLLNTGWAIVHTGVAGRDEWISLNNAVLIPEDMHLPESLASVVSFTGTKLVSLCSNQWRVLGKYYSCELTKISPSLVRNILKQNQYCYCNLPQEEKLVTLKYCLFDKNYLQLAELELIPLANGTFSHFVQCDKVSMHSVKRTADVYVCSSSIPHNLLPGLEHIMVEHSYYSLMEEVAKSGDTQLVILTEAKVAELLPQSNPQSWSSAQLEIFWKWLENRSLTHFSNLPIVPVLNAASGVQSMHNLSKQSCIVHVPSFQHLEHSLRTSLEKCGGKFLCISEFPHLNHRQIGSFTLNFRTISDVLDALSDANFIDRLKFSNTESIAVQNFFKSMDNLNAHQVNKICAMAIFSVIQRTAPYSINQVKPTKNNKALVRKEAFLFGDELLLSHPLVFETGQPLLNKVPDHVVAIDEVKYLEVVIFPGISNGKFPQDNIDTLMTCILDNIRTYINKYHHQNKSLTDVLSNLKFVTVENNNREAPSSLFDRSESILCRLYQGKPVFPSGVYTKYVRELQQCGLKHLSSITASMLYQVAKDISMPTACGLIVQSSPETFDRALALMQVLKENCSITLDHSVMVYNQDQQTLVDAICQLVVSHALLPIASNKPLNYPDCLTWKGSSHDTFLTKFDASNVIVLPNTVDHCSLFINPRIIGSEALFVQNIPLPICQRLMQSSQANLSSCVVRHFKHVIQNKEEIDPEILQQISFQTYKYLNSINCQVCLSSNERWVWVESRSKFCTPEMCSISSLSISLEPFIYVLPKNMKQYEKFLCRHGVQWSITSEHIMSVLKNISMLSDGNNVVSAKDARILIRNILEWVVENEIDSENILVPISSKRSFPKLSPVNEVFYIDNEVLLEIAESVDDDYTLVDPSIKHLAPKLDIIPLSDHLDITGEVFEDAGQHESLTTRLSNILKEYKDGLTIIKEMIQNADDAEATEVNILYDSREHTKEKLLFKEMANSHGPALVVHNNAKFTKEDFTNITKLAAATKKDKPLKIGKFGVGFCSVYHITDVPSFVSGDWLYIFDPTLSHLKAVVKNENQPGKKVKYTSKFIAKTNQLAPYQNLFTFDASCEYEGTMFRFPFRKHPSQISSTLYNTAMVDQLKEDLKENGKLFLLFLSNVKRIRFLSISSGQSTPAEEIVIEKFSTRLMEKTLIKTDTTDCQTKTTSEEYWLVSTKKEDKYHIYKKTTQSATASVACQLTEASSGQYQVAPLDGLVFCYLPLSVPSTGLPVHISANFAIMSNRSGIWTSAGSSATPSDSREWWNQQLMVTVIQTAYCELLMMLKELFIKLENYNCHTLLPLGSSIQHPWQMMIESLCQTLVDSPLFYSKFSNKWFTLNHTRFLSHDILSTVHSTAMPQCVIDCLSIMELPVVDIHQQYLDRLKSILHDITIAVLDQNEFCSNFMEKIEMFSDQWETRNEVLFNIFTTAASEIASEGRSELTKLLENHACIPTTPDGARLKLANHLVDPKSDLKQLFSEKSEVFPIPMFYDRQAVHELMVNIGLLTTHLPWDMVLECVKSIPAVYKIDSETALQRISILLKTIKKNTNKDDYASNPAFCELKNTCFIPVAKPPEGYMLSWKGAGMDLSSPANVFYPARIVNSYSEKHSCIKRECWLLGSQRLIVNSCFVEEGGCGTIDHTVLKALEIDSNAHLDDVLANYQELLGSQHTITTNDDVETMEYICQMTYEFFEDSLKNESSQQSSQSSTIYKSYYRMTAAEPERVQSTRTRTAISEFQSKPSVWVGKCFVYPKNMASKWNENGPFLYKVPSIISEHKLLISALGIEEKFTIKKLLNTLKEMHQVLGENQLDGTHQKVVNAIVGELNTYRNEDFKDIQPDVNESVILPSAVNTLMLAKSLSYNDSQWLAADENSTLVHKVLQREIALALGVKPIRAEFLEKFASKNDEFGGTEGTEFGQREELTQRIRNILHDYPLDVTILKELLQNADDAGATKMCIILDKRQHGTERLPSKEWSELQGPALVVWNNKEFTEKDMKGIQKLGLGSKRENLELIGQFGIGFNVVYHLTDCPSFITGGRTLCVFDPCCRYAPGATAFNPGRRYDGLQDDRFWDGMSDMRSAYFQSQPLQDQPTELNQGSLFRFPLRSTESEIIKNKEQAEKLSVDVMEKKLDDWVPQIKEALLFLNHITEFSYYVVDKYKQFNLKCQFKLSMDSAAVESHANLLECLKEFKDKRQPRVFNYQINYHSRCVSSLVPLSTKPVPSQSLETCQEKWFIQLGVGDISKSESEQKWQHIDRVIPKHGIATPVKVSQQFTGKLFCFLPLQTYSGLPVHINGQFVLSSNRCSLWAGSGEGADDKRDWNDLLFEAIASSYVHFMTEIRDVIVKDEGYPDKELFNASVDKYYSLFPTWEGDASLEKQNCLGMPKVVFQRIWQSNAKVLAVEIHSKKETTAGDKTAISTVKVQWNCLRNKEDAFKQVYFQPQLDNMEEKQEVVSLLSCIKMRLTCAPLIFYKNLITNDETKPSIATPESVFQFYCSFHSQIIPQGCPCPIQDTPFKTAEIFYQFVKYILAVAKPDSIEKQFPQAPFGYPLLLTADNVLHCFDQPKKVIQSTLSKLFRRSLSKFLHEVFQCQLKFDSDYFLSTNDIEWPIVQDLLKNNLPNKLQEFDNVNNTDENICISLEDLKSIWECLTSKNDPLLKNHQKEILSMWALTPATNGYLYSTRCSGLPIMPPCLDELDSIDKTACNIFIRVGLSVINGSELPSDCGLLNTCQAYFPTIKHYDWVLTILYHLHQEQNIFGDIKNNDVRGILKYFQRTGFTHNLHLKNQMLALPLFKSLEGHLTSLNNKKVYLWPHSGFCDAGYSRWAPSDSVLFLEYNGDWRALSNDFASITERNLDEKEIYIELVFPCFGRLSLNERKDHLEYIMENIYPGVKRSTEAILHNRKKHLSKQMLSDLSFIENLKKLKCIEHPKTQLLCPISDFSDHTEKIFGVFSEAFIFLPLVYQKDEWYEFFCDLDLQKTVNAKSFINFCFKIQNGTHTVENIEAASRVLLEYLFSSKAREWDDESLQAIADICFVKVAEVPHLSWIKAPCSPPKEILSAGIKLTKLNQSVVLEAAALIWTVKPVFHPPSLIDTTEKNYQDQATFLKKLSVTSTPYAKDIVAHLLNISKSRFSNVDLFNTYPPECLQESADQPSLLDIVSMCLDKLKTSKECSLDLLSQLKDCACVPIVARPLQVVLVRPIQVVKMFSEQEDAQFKPYINVLPAALVSCYSVLENFGVCNTIDLVHVRFVLKTLHSKFDEGRRTDDPNIIQLMHLCIVKLNKLLSKEDMRDKQDTADHLNPLYLPFSTGQHSWSLKLSEKLVFVDSSRYQSRQPRKLNLAQTDYALFEIPEDRNVAQMSYTSLSLTEKSFCLKLPTKVRPLQLSLCSLEKKLSGSIVTAGANDIVIAFLNQSKSFLEKFESILRRMLALHMGFESDSEMEPFIVSFFKIMTDIDIVLIQGLQASLIFKDKNIATLDSPEYVLEREHDKYTLYVDQSESAEPEFFEELSRTLLIEIARLTKNTNLICYFEMIKPISRFFQVHSSAALQKLRTEYPALIGEEVTWPIEKNAPRIPVVGKKVPEIYMSQLDCNINNIFDPQEWVAYEISEQSFIWAMVLYCVSPDQSNGSNHHLLDRYKIVIGVISDSENEERDVSVLDLYKILPNIISETQHFPDDISRSCRQVLTVAANTVIAIKDSIYADLKRISQLTVIERRKAEKRLYLQYHPDKVKLSNKAANGKEFEYFKRQVDRLEKGEFLKGPDATDDDDDTARHTAYELSQMSSSYFNQWESYIARYTQNVSSQEHHARPACRGELFNFNQPQRDQDKAKLWLKQSHTDYRAMKILLAVVRQYHYEKGNKDSVICQTIFLAREIVDKALKAGMYKLVGRNEAVYLKRHELVYHARSISSQRPSANKLTSNSSDYIASLEDIARWIDHFYLDSRFPYSYSNFKAPVDVCSREDAEKAADYAQMTLDFIDSL